MDRRHLIAGGAAAFAASLPLARPARSDTQCSPYDYNGVQLCQSGIPLGPVITARQQCPQWCWAASIETAFAIWGYIVDQETIVRRIYPDMRCQPAVNSQINSAATGLWTDKTGKRFRSEANNLLNMELGVPGYNLGASVANSLAMRIPLINGAMSHATVLTAITYFRDVYGRGQVTQITVRDPWPDSPNMRTLSANEVQGTFYVTQIRAWPV